MMSLGSVATVGGVPSPVGVDMTWLWIILAVWFVASPLVSIGVGRAVTIAESRRTLTAERRVVATRA